MTCSFCLIFAPNFYLFIFLFMTTGFKIFGSQDWLKVCDISILEYKKEKLDEKGNTIPLMSNGQPVYKMNYTWTKISVDENGQNIVDTVKESKGWRLKLEFTDDGFKTKKIIYLQDGEVSDFIAILLWKKDKGYFARENKSVTVEYQGDNSFMKFSQKDNNVSKFYPVKIDKFSSLRIIAFAVIVLQYEFKRDLGIAIDQKVILESIIGLNTKPSQTVTVPVTQVWQTVTQEWVNTAPTTSVTPVCSDCGKAFDMSKEEKVVKFSTQKFGKPVCFGCQKTHV